MEAVRRFLNTPARSAIGMLAAAARGGATVGLFMLAEHVRHSGLFGRLLLDEDACGGSVVPSWPSSEQ